MGGDGGILWAAAAAMVGAILSSASRASAYVFRHCPQADSFFGFFFGFGFFFPGTTTTSAGKKEEKVKFWVFTSRVLFVCCPHRPLENDRSETQYLIE